MRRDTRGAGAAQAAGPVPQAHLAVAEVVRLVAGEGVGDEHEGDDEAAHGREARPRVARLQHVHLGGVWVRGVGE